MKKYPYVPTDLVKAVNGVLDKKQNVVEQDLRRRHCLDEGMSGQGDTFEGQNVVHETKNWKLEIMDAGRHGVTYKLHRKNNNPLIFDVDRTEQSLPSKELEEAIKSQCGDPNCPHLAAAIPHVVRDLQEAMGLPTPTYDDIDRQLNSKDQIMFNTIVTGYPQHAITWLDKNPTHPNAKHVADILDRNLVARGGSSMFAKRLPQEPVTESPVAGVIKGQLPGNQHMCATKIFSEQFGEGTPVYSMHADPDEHGLIEWYDVMFEHGIERVFTEDVEVLAEMSHGDDHDDDKKKRGKKHKKSHMKKEKDDEDDDDMKMESNGYADVDAALADMGEIEAFNDANPTERRRARTPTRLTDPKEVAKYKRMQRRILTKRGLSTDIVKESKKPKAEIIAASMERNQERSEKLKMEAKEEPTFDIEKSLPTNAHTSGFQVAIKAINQSGLPNKADFRHAIAQAVEHPNFKKKMLGALSKPQGAEEVLKIAAEFLETQKQGEPSKPRQMSFLKTESVDIVKSAIKRLRESQQMLLPLDVGAPNFPLHHGYQFRHGWKVIANAKSAEHPFRLERTATNGKTHVVQLPDHVKTVKDLMQHLGTNPKTTTYTSRGGVDAGTPGNLFQTVAFDRS